MLSFKWHNRWFIGCLSMSINLTSQMLEKHKGCTALMTSPTEAFDWDILSIIIPDVPYFSFQGLENFINFHYLKNDNFKKNTTKTSLDIPITNNTHLHEHNQMFFSLGCWHLARSFSALGWWRNQVEEEDNWGKITVPSYTQIQKKERKPKHILKLQLNQE